MKLFEYTEPKLSKPKDNKWFVRYSITYKGQKAGYPKEYGRYYFGIILNKIKGLKLMLSYG